MRSVLGLRRGVSHLTYLKRVIELCVCCVWEARHRNVDEEVTHCLLFPQSGSSLPGVVLEPAHYLHPDVLLPLQAHAFSLILYAALIIHISAFHSGHGVLMT